MEKRFLYTLIGVFLGVVLIAGLVAAAQPIVRANGNADLRRLDETAKLRMNVRILGENGEAAGRYFFEQSGFSSRAEVAAARVVGNDVYFTGPLQNSDQWIYVAARDNGPNDIVWVMFAEQDVANTMVLSGAFPGEGWVVEKGGIRVR